MQHEIIPAVSVFELDPFIDTLRIELSRLSRQNQITFAARICNRLAPKYERLTEYLGSNDFENFKTILLRTQHLSQLANVPTEDLEVLLKECDNLALGDENCCAQWRDAVDAVQSLWYTVKACTGNTSEHTARAGGCAINVVYQNTYDEIIGAAHGPKSKQELSPYVEKINTSPAMVEEKTWLRNQLEEISGLPQ